MKRNLQKHLEDLEAAELREEIQMLYDRFDNVRAYYKMELSGGTEATVEKYKKKIHHCFFPGRGRGKRARSQSRDLIKEFKQISIFPADVVELELYRTQMMVEWVIYWYNESNAYFESITKAYHNSCQMIVDQQLENKFAEQARVIARSFQDYRRRGKYTLLADYIKFFKMPSSGWS